MKLLDHVFGEGHVGRGIMYEGEGITIPRDLLFGAIRRSRVAENHFSKSIRRRDHALQPIR